MLMFAVFWPWTLGWDTSNCIPLYRGPYITRMCVCLFIIIYVWFYNTPRPVQVSRNVSTPVCMDSGPSQVIFILLAGLLKGFLTNTTGCPLIIVPQIFGHVDIFTRPHPQCTCSFSFLFSLSSFHYHHHRICFVFSMSIRGFREFKVRTSIPLGGMLRRGHYLQLLCSWFWWEDHNRIFPPLTPIPFPGTGYARRYGFSDIFAFLENEFEEHGMCAGIKDADDFFGHSAWLFG